MRKLIYILFLFFISISAFATHNRAGEITYRHISNLEYEFTILTYTYTPSPADRPELEIFFGDGTSAIFPRTLKLDLPNDISRNEYKGTHLYTAPGTFTVSLEDPNRNGGSMNIPNSVNVPFYIQTILVINPFLGYNDSPVLLNPPIDNGCVNYPFVHNPCAFVLDGDSLSYKLVNCKGADGLDIPAYTLPAASISIKINPITGDLLWDSPIAIGEYNIAILIQEWRNGILIGCVTRDMQIYIASCNNRPPIIEDLKDTCVLEGTLLSFNVTANDVDGDNITLTGNGLPLILGAANGPATFTQPVYGIGTVSSTFIWQTQCNHVRKQPYQMTFKAIDNGSPVRLVDYESILITVVAPATPNLVATPIGNNIKLTWDQSPCTNAVGYKIYRRNGSYGYVPNHCELGVPAYTGYIQIATVKGLSNTSFLDNDNGAGLVHGFDYCYMVIAYFSDGAESYASNETCTSLIKDVPVITNVSINHTDIVNGAVYVAWSKPTMLNTSIAPGPYKYKIYRSNDLLGKNMMLLDSLYINQLNDTIFTDTILNTLDHGWSYQIDLWNETLADTFLIGSTQIASSVFLTLTPSDNRLIFDFAPVIPWINDTMVIYRQNSITLKFDSIGFSKNHHYIDSGLVNNRTYCYKVKTIGHYYTAGIIDPIINFSEEKCGIPIDNIPPCPPELLVIPDCDKIENSLIWTYTNRSCFEDVLFYRIYYSAVKESNLELLTTINNPNDTDYIHQLLNSIAGCYAITAVDSFNNESQLSNIVCIDIDSCDLYILPNVFTPDGDSYNDLFVPFPYKFVEKINLQIFDRWGTLVFTTENPDIKWNGKNKITNINCNDGVYFYICDVYEIRLSGIKRRTINGSLTLLRSK